MFYCALDTKFWLLPRIRMFAYKFKCLCKPKAAIALFYVLSFSGQGKDTILDRAKMM